MKCVAQLGLESLGEPQILDPTDPTKHVADSINKYAQEPLGRPHLESHQQAYR